MGREAASQTEESVSTVLTSWAIGSLTGSSLGLLLARRFREEVPTADNSRLPQLHKDWEQKAYTAARLGTLAAGMLGGAFGAIATVGTGGSATLAFGVGALSAMQPARGSVDAAIFAQRKKWLERSCELMHSKRPAVMAARPIDAGVLCYKCAAWD